MKKYLLTTAALSLSLLMASSYADSAQVYQIKHPLTNFNTMKEKYYNYYQSGEYAADQRVIARSAMKYLDKRVKANNKRAHKKLAVVFDLDETLLSNWGIMKQMFFPMLRPDGDFQAYQARAEDTAIMPTFRVYQRALQDHVAVFFITGRGDNLRAATIKNLQRRGMELYTKLILRPSNLHNARIYKSAERKKIEEQGYDIVFSMGDQYSDLCGGYDDRDYKLPNPF